MIRRSLQFQLAAFLPQAIPILCDSFPAVVDALKRQPADLVVLDLLLAGTDYRQTIQLIRSLNPTGRILIFSGLDEQCYALPALQAGAAGYLSKLAPESEFEQAIQTLMNQERYVSPAVGRSLVNNLGRTGFLPGENPLETLSPGEQKVLHLLREGKWTKEIAASLHLKQNTVSTVKKRIFEKLAVESMVELLHKVDVYSN
ncbi:hypothetical protein GCM10028773_11220 [Spirosoma koreense]